MRRLLLSTLAMAWAVVSATSPETTISATGILYLTFDIGMGNHTEGVLFGRFVPDPDSIRKFPAVTSGQYPGSVTYISFRPTEQLLEAVVGASEAARLSRDWARIVQIPVAVTFKDYQAVIECDARAYQATVVSVKALDSAQVANRDDAPIGC